MSANSKSDPQLLGRRWAILAMLVGFSTVSYIERVNLSVAGPFIRGELNASDVQLGWMFSAFLVGYTLAQVPSGAVADRYGAHRVLTVAALAWFLLTVFLALSVSFVGAASLALGVSTVVLLRFLLGIAEAPTYPAATRAVATWFPQAERARANAIIQSASFAGSAITLPVMAAAVAAWGWRHAMFLTALPALLIGVLWWRFGSERNSPRAAESALAKQDNCATSAPVCKRSVFVLSLSYFFHGYVGYLFFFWFYSYLVEARGFSIAQSGWIAALPAAAAAIAALAGGWASDRLAERWGDISGRRVIILLSGLLGALSLLIGAFSASPALAISGFVLAIATRGFVEASYWTLAIEIGGARVGTVAGTMNAFCNIGGAISTALAPFLVHSLGWPGAISVAALATGVSGMIAILLHPVRGSLKQEMKLLEA